MYRKQAPEEQSPAEPLIPIKSARAQLAEWMHWLAINCVVLFFEVAGVVLLYVFLRHFLRHFARHLVTP